MSLLHLPYHPAPVLPIVEAGLGWVIVLLVFVLLYLAAHR